MDLCSIGNTNNIPEFLPEQEWGLLGYRISGYRRTKHAMSLKWLKTCPLIRGNGEVFPGPATFWGPVTAQNYWQRCFR